MNREFLLVGKSLRRLLLGAPEGNGRIPLRWILRRMVVRIGSGWI
jgi:hypothetical protein